MRKLGLLVAAALVSTGAAFANEEACTVDSAKSATPCSTAAPNSLARFGLREGDVVISFDGKKIDRPGDTKALFEKLASGTVKRVVVLRNGQRKTLKISK